MKIIIPNDLLRETADVLAPVRDEIVVIGASAVQVALFGRDAIVTYSR